MLERGVLPDLLPPDFSRASRFSMSFGRGVRQIELAISVDNKAMLNWRVAAAPAQWLPKLDSIALDCLDPNEVAARRWLRLAPRYLGRLAQGVHLLCCDEETAQRFLQQVRERMQRSEIGVPVEIRFSSRNECEEHIFSPPGDTENSR
jgi:hypothetical protein